MIVRLKAQSAQGKDCNTCRFQFYDSPIKSFLLPFCLFSFKSFNSMIVRLKDGTERDCIFRYNCFNSMIVRLKGRHRY